MWRAPAPGDLELGSSRILVSSWGGSWCERFSISRAFSSKSSWWPSSESPRGHLSLGDISVSTWVGVEPTAPSRKDISPTIFVPRTRIAFGMVRDIPAVPGLGTAMQEHDLSSWFIHPQTYGKFWRAHPSQLRVQIRIRPEHLHILYFQLHRLTPSLRFNCTETRSLMIKII